MIDKKIYDEIPEGWKRINGATCHPPGMFWICNGKSMFSKDRLIALCRKK